MGLLKSFKEFAIGRKRKTERIPRYTEQQEDALSQLLSMGMQNVDPQAMEDRYMKLFQEQIVPGIAEQFATSGSGLGSSRFKSSVGRAGSDLASQLASLRGQRGMQMAKMGLGEQFHTEAIPGAPGHFQRNIGNVMDIIGQMFLGRGGGGGQKQEGDDSLYFGGQPQGYSATNIAPLALKLMLGGL